MTRFELEAILLAATGSSGHKTACSQCGSPLRVRNLRDVLQVQFQDTLGTGGAQLRDEVADFAALDHCFDGNPGLIGQVVDCRGMQAGQQLGNFVQDLGWCIHLQEHAVTGC